MTLNTPPLDLEAATGRRIRELRVARDMSQAGLGEALAPYGYEFSQPLVHRVEVGRRPLRINEAAGFAAVLGVPLIDLLGARDPDFGGRVNDSVITAQRSAEAIAAAERAQQAVEEAQRHLDKATEDLRTALRKRTEAVVAHRVATMR
jgi:transcriptional regulator with XRE-family HTH domain